MKFPILVISAVVILSLAITPEYSYAKRKKHRVKKGVGCEAMSQQNLSSRANKYIIPILKAARKYKVSPELIKSVITIESCFKSKAKGTSGEKGLMQLMPATARRFGVKNGFNPHQNIDGGTRYLKFLLHRYSGNKQLTFAAYNGGEGRVDRYKRVPPRVRHYVKKAMRAYTKFSKKKVKAIPKISKITNAEWKKLRIKHKVSYKQGFYTVKAGDTLYEVMRQTGVSVKTLRNINQLSATTNIKTGQRLILAKNVKLPIVKLKPKVMVKKVNFSRVANNDNKAIYIAKKGDTLNKIMWKTGIPVQKLKQLNGIKNSTTAIKTGQKLRILSVKKAKVVTITSATHYIVKSGDTLYEIMRKTAVPVKKLKQLNKLDSNFTLKAGQRLKVK